MLQTVRLCLMRGRLGTWPVGLQLGAWDNWEKSKCSQNTASVANPGVMGLCFETGILGARDPQELLLLLTLAHWEALGQIIYPL